MKKSYLKKLKETKITIDKIKYGFVVTEKQIGIRRIDQKLPSEKEIDKVTLYIINEGWADDIYFNEEDFGGLV